VQVIRAGVRLNVAEYGSGAAVLWHTGGAGDGRMWLRAGYPTGLTGYRSLLLDHRGHGGSDAPRDPDQHRLDEYVADVIAILDTADVQRAALVGYSDGMLVVLAAAARHPERVGAVVGLGAIGPPGQALHGRAARAQSVRAAGIADVVQRIAADEPQQPPPWLIDNLSRTDTEMYALELEGFATAPDPWQTIMHVRAPTLLICGAAEYLGAATDLRRAAAAMPHGTALVCEGMGHLQTFWRTDTTLEPIREFIAGHHRTPRDAGY
jgi:pimeloyl-ACP methyl ester carboxylesterase